jgi:hypothetical protein
MVKVTLYFLACGNDNNGNGRCNGIFSVTIKGNDWYNGAFFNVTLHVAVGKKVTFKCTGIFEK